MEIQAMRAILINPIDKTIKEVEFDGSSKHIYELIKSDTFQMVRMDDHHFVLVDEMGFVRKEIKPLFQHSCYPKPMAGLGLVVGVDENGDDLAPCKLSLEEVTSATVWPKVKFAGITESLQYVGNVAILSRETNFEPEN